MKTSFRTVSVLFLLTVLYGCANMKSTQSEVGVSGAESAQAEPESGASKRKIRKKVKAEQPVPLSADVLYSILAGEIAGQRGRFDIAARQYLFAARISKHRQVAERAARIAVYAGEVDVAREASLLLSQLAPESVEAQELAGVLQLAGGMEEGAYERFDSVINLYSEGKPKAFLRIARLLIKENKSKLAVTTLTRLAEKYPNISEAWVAIGMLAGHAAELDAADAALIRALQLRPNWVQALSLRAQILVRLERQDEAEALLLQAVQQQPDDSAMRVSLARIHLQTNKYLEAKQQFKEALRIKPDSADTLYALGLLSLELNQSAEAKRYFLALRKDGSERQDAAAYYLGQIAESASEFNVAIEWYEKVEPGAQYIDTNLKLAGVLVQLGRLPEARSRLKDLRFKNPGSEARLYLVEGQILSNLKQYNEAYDLYSLALTDYPNDSGLRYARALVAEKRNRIDLLEEDLAIVLEKDPNNADALNALGYTLVDRTTRFQEAEKYIVRALQLKPDSPGVIDSMGWLQYRLGNISSAIEYLRKALSFGYDSEISSHLAEVLRADGQVVEARSLLENALKDHPENEYLLEAYGRLQNAVVIP